MSSRRLCAWKVRGSPGRRIIQLGDVLRPDRLAAADPRLLARFDGRAGAWHVAEGTDGVARRPSAHKVSARRQHFPQMSPRRRVAVVFPPPRDGWLTECDERPSRAP